MVDNRATMYAFKDDGQYHFVAFGQDNTKPKFRSAVNSVDELAEIRGSRECKDLHLRTSTHPNFPLEIVPGDPRPLTKEEIDRLYVVDEDLLVAARDDDRFHWFAVSRRKGKETMREMRSAPDLTALAVLRNQLGWQDHRFRNYDPSKRPEGIATIEGIRPLTGQELRFLQEQMTGDEGFYVALSTDIGDFHYVAVQDGQRTIGSARTLEGLSKAKNDGPWRSQPIKNFDHASFPQDVPISGLEPLTDEELKSISPPVPSVKELQKAWGNAHD